MAERRRRRRRAVLAGAAWVGLGLLGAWLGRGLLAAALLGTGCLRGALEPADALRAPGATQVSPCTARPERVGTTPAELDELSGLVASRQHPGVFWAHNDSGNAPRLYALGADGLVRAVFRLEGVRVRDLEDIALGPCGAAQCLFLADIGDNLGLRRQVQLLRVEEPARLEDGVLRPEPLPFSYADGARDAESLVVEPATGVPYVLSKELTVLGHLYRVEGLGPGRVGRAVRVATLRAPQGEDGAATAADLAPSGTRLLVRTYRRVWEWEDPAARSLEALVRGPPRRAPAASQPQGEALALLADGSGYLLGSEGEGAPLFLLRCTFPSSN